MSSTLQRLSGIASIALLSVALAACGGSDAVDATKSAGENAVAASENAVAAAEKVIESAGDSAKSAIDSAGAVAKESVGNAGSAAKGVVEAAGAAANTVVEGAASMAAAVAAGPDLAAGEKTYGRFCFSCHAAGVAGAPKLGDTEAWAPRLAKGLDLLVASTISGIPPAMPARGLCMNCSDDDLRNTVAWMIAQ